MFVGTNRGGGGGEVMVSFDPIIFRFVRSCCAFHPRPRMGAQTVGCCMGENKNTPTIHNQIQHAHKM